MTIALRHRFDSTKDDLKQKRKLSGWVLPKQTTTFADPDKWSNIDADVTPVERRTWTSLTILGFWISDALNAQGWEAPSSIIALGLTWREAVYCIILGSLIDTIPLVLNGAIGAHLHVPFPVAARSSFGFYLARFAVVVRMITALFWHAIQTWTGSMAMAQCIRAIWPSYLDIPNTIPTSVGASSQDLIAHFVFWSVQFPILLTPPHKLKWFFWFKSIVVISVSVATVIAMTQKAGGAGDIWKQEYQVHGSTRSWMIMSSMMSITGGWATMATNIPDFTRYLRKPEGIYWQALFLPVIKLVVAMFGTICTSSAKVVYGEYIWDPLTLAAQWDGPAGRCGAFFVGFAWVVAQIGTNLSANVISASNDLVNLFPKYVSIRRGVVVITVTAGWIMVPWKIVNSAQSLMNFMSGLAIFLCPIAAILSTDYWLVKKRAVDVPSLYRRRARYRYDYGCNWRAAVAFLVSVSPNLPGMAQAVNPSISLSAGIEHVYDMYYLYGFASASFVYWGLSYAFPATETLLEASIHDDPEVMDGLEYRKDDVHMPELSSENKSPSKTIKESLADIGQV
ncbi:uridine permease-like protein Fui1 [Hortaea werneckii]|nr:uridine permease-like protein Fui1 [Hortaea werneckii]